MSVSDLSDLRIIEISGGYDNFFAHCEDCWFLSTLSALNWWEHFKKWHICIKSKHRVSIKLYHSQIKHQFSVVILKTENLQWWINFESRIQKSETARLKEENVWDCFSNNNNKEHHNQLQNSGIKKIFFEGDKKLWKQQRSLPVFFKVFKKNVYVLGEMNV